MEFNGFFGTAYPVTGGIAVPFFSLCMIVKNEESVIARCLESVHDVFDEIIICDTGSTDNTKEIAGWFTDKVFDFKWCDDFSRARNFAFSKSSGDYNMWLDADDVLTEENRLKLLDLKNNIPAQTDVVMMPYCTAFDENGTPTFTFYRERIVKNDGRLLFSGRVHEVIVPRGKVIYSDIAVYHKSIKQNYSNRNLLIYEKQIADGESLTERDKFYYGRELYYHKKYDKCREILTDFLNGDGWIENKIEACKIIAYSYLADGETDKAVSALTDSFLYDSPRAEICCELGYIFIKKEMYSTAAFWFKTALDCPKSTNGAFVSEDCYGFIPAIELAVCYDKLGDIKTAEYYNELAGTFKPDAPSYLYNKQYFNKKHYE